MYMDEHRVLSIFVSENIIGILSQRIIKWDGLLQVVKTNYEADDYKFN